MLLIPLHLRRSTFAQFEDAASEEVFFADFERRKVKLDDIESQLAEAIEAYRAAAQMDDVARRHPSEETRRLNARVVELSAAFTSGLRELEHFVGVPDEVFEEIATARRPPREECYWRADGMNATLISPAPLRISTTQLVKSFRESPRYPISFVGLHRLTDHFIEAAAVLPVTSS